MFPRHLDHVISGMSQDSVFFVLWEVGIRNVKPNLPVRKTLDASVVEKAEVLGVNDCVGSNMTGQFVDDFELTLGITNQQKSHAYTCQPSFKVSLP